MTARFPPERPASFRVEGEYSDGHTSKLAVVGRLVVTGENEVHIDGHVTHATPGQHLSRRTGSFTGRLDDGTEVTLPWVEQEQMKFRMGQIGSGWELRLKVLGHADWIAIRSEPFHELDCDVAIWWTLNHSPLLWQSARRFYTFELDKMGAAGVTPMELHAAIARPRPSACSWVIAGVTFEIGWFEEKFPATDIFTGYPVVATRFLPRVKANTHFTGSNEALLDEIARVEGLVECLLSCISFLQAGRVTWYERLEEAFERRAADSHSRTQILQSARLRIGRIPDAVRDSARAARSEQILSHHTPKMMERFAAGEPFTSAALDVYLLAAEAQHWPSRLMLISTALESLKELFLRSQPVRGVLREEHWAQIKKEIERQLKQAWRDEYGPKELRGLVKGKMPELNRPTYRATLQAMVFEWGANMDGLDDPLAFIDLRNTVVHTGRVPNDDYTALAKATKAATALFERLMEAWLQVTTAGPGSPGPA